MDLDDRVSGAAAGVLLALAVAGGLVPWRDQVSIAVGALLLVLPVVVASAIGGRAAGAYTAVASTLSFDFFLTQPYGSLKIASGTDAGTAGVLLVVALIVGTVAARGVRSRREAAAQQAELNAVHRVAALVVAGATADRLVDAAQAELVRLLGLERCEYLARGAGGAQLPELGHSGRVTTQFHRFTGEGFELPLGAELPARGPAGEHGRFVLYGRPGTAVSLHARRAAVLIADLVGAALEGDGTAGGASATA